LTLGQLASRRQTFSPEASLPAQGRDVFDRACSPPLSADNEIGLMALG
jgi:hypothetical protein